MQQRMDVLDFLKGIFVILMITFHLVYISESYPYVKRVVYTFHMPGFLIISGYLMNISKPRRDVMGTLLGYAIPYIIMECGYIVMASALPIREHIDHLTWRVFIEKLFLHPIGPYWYLQTLIVCGLSYFTVFMYIPMKTVSKIILLGIIFHLLSDGVGLMTLACSLYFLVGVIVRQSHLSFTDVFQSSGLAILAFMLLAIHPQNLQMEQSGAGLMVFLIISGSLFAFNYTNLKLRLVILYLGKHTMPLFLFSPIFTFLCKPLVPLLQFEPTGIVFLCVSLLICTAGSLGIEWTLKQLGLTQYFYMQTNNKMPNTLTKKKQ
jgi:fucose 4-O-acetylase-like acetyltransferase